MNIIETCSNMVSFNEEMSEMLSNYLMTPCVAIEIADLACGVAFTMDTVWVYGIDVTQPLISRFWDANAGCFSTSFRNATTHKQKTDVAAVLLLSFIEKLKDFGILQSLIEKVSAKRKKEQTMSKGKTINTYKCSICGKEA